MSGRHIYTSDVYARRDFFKQLLGFAGASALLASVNSCSSTTPYDHITGGFVSPAYKVGHLLRYPEKIPAPTTEIDTNVLIAGGGIAGLSAMRWLGMNDVHDVMMVELDDAIGGNATYGENAVSKYPWAAHYMPIPDNNNIELLDFLKEAGVVIGFDKNGLPHYNEMHICHDPESRLYINGLWQKGLVPAHGISDNDEQQIKRFFELIGGLKEEKGEDGRFHFSLPVDSSSTSKKYKGLDNISFSTYLKKEGYTSEYLLWYLAYCTKDDYGAMPKDVSAWAGLNYFAARRGIAANVPESSILTWPEGNGFLKDVIERKCTGTIKKNMMVYDVQQNEDKVLVSCYDAVAQKSVMIKANKLLLSTPQYVNDRIQKRSRKLRLDYTPWVIANITYNRLPTNIGMPLCWDNVIYNKPSVGYVYANHQEVNRANSGVITYYLPITTADTNKARQQVREKEYDYWKKYFVDELEYAHTGASKFIKHIDVRVLGHGMIRPSVDYIWGKERKGMMVPIENKVFFAHSDLGGISVFEEAFYQGIRAAKEIMK